LDNLTPNVFLLETLTFNEKRAHVALSITNRFQKYGALSFSYLTRKQSEMLSPQGYDTTSLTKKKQLPLSFNEANLVKGTPNNHILL
jgi:hypothetical protein